jgi:hypothetical protein
MRKEYGRVDSHLTTDYQNRKCEIPFICWCNLYTRGADLSPPKTHSRKHIFF